MKVVAFFQLHEVHWAISDTDLARLRARFAPTQIVSVEDADRLGLELSDADVFVGFHLPRRLFASAAKLRWVHSASAGIEANLFPELVASDVVLTNSAGLHAVSIPEHVLGQMLILARNFHEAQRLQSRCEWNRFQVIAFGAGVSEINGSHVAVLGAGAIGRNVTRLAAGLGAHVRVMRRDPRRGAPGAEGVYAPAALRELLGWADFVILAVPLTGETRALIGREELAAMKSGAYLINIARGEVVDEEALVAALRSSSIAGAALDVFSQEPLPSDHPFWSLPNLVLTPHVSGYTPQYFDKVLALFEDNLERFVHARPLRNIVDKQLGYSREG